MPGAVQLETKVGKIKNVVPQKHYGFIETDSNEKFFFHLHNARTEKCVACGSTVAIMPALNAIVRFKVVRQSEPGKMDRAIDLEVL